MRNVTALLSRHARIDMRGVNINSWRGGVSAG
jgi:hypothetical protein